jgi:hypothetical protein
MRIPALIPYGPAGRSRFRKRYGVVPSLWVI